MNIDEVVLNFSKESLFVLNLSLGLIMFGVAINLTIADFKRVVTQPKSVLIGIASQFLLLPALTFLLILLIQPKASFALGMMLVAACPGGNISNFMAAKAGANTALSVTLTAVSSLACVIATPLNLALWAQLYEPTQQLFKQVSLNFYELLQTITTLLIIPILLGMALRHFKPRWADRLHPILHFTSILIFSAIVLMAFKANFDLFLKYIHLVVFLVFLHNALALIGGYQLATLAKLGMPERKSIAIETGIQNSGLGLILIFAFFDGLGGMAIVAAWWGIWHIVSGLGLSFYWDRKRSLAT